MELISVSIKGGYMKKILKVNLKKSKFDSQELEEDYAAKYIGGAGYAARTLYNLIDSGTDPLGPENALFIIAGPMVGSTFPGGTKWTICFKSPSTNIWGESSGSGLFGAEMKHSGFDGILVIGRAENPVFIQVVEGGCEIKDASYLWGKDTYETAEAIKSDLSDKMIRVACIGPAGERLVRMSSVVTDEGRVCGRAGVGAVMGSKNLKAVAVRGHLQIPLAEPDRVKELSEEARKAVKPPTSHAYTRVESLSTNGTAGGIEGLEVQGGLPVKNWTKTSFPEASKITGSTITKTILARRGMCALCTLITCWRYVKLNENAPVIRGPEYETLAALGSLCMNSDLSSIVKANEICDRLGVDTISAGSAIAFAMECYEKGLIKREETRGLDLSWGNSEAVVELVKDIGLRRALGALLGEGVKRAAEKIGRGAEEYAVHVKGLEVPLHEPRRWWTMALAYATSNRGACHHQGIPAYLEWGLLQREFGFSEKLKPFDVDKDIEAVKFHQDFHAAFTSMGHCAFTIGGVVPFNLVAEGFKAVTGIETDHWQLLKKGERIWNVKRAFNLKMGMAARDDRLPRRLLQPLPDSEAEGKVPPIDLMLKRYYELRGWIDGKPSKEKLEELDMQDISKDIWSQ